MKKLLKHSDYEMDSNKKLITTALFIATAVLGSTFSFPILGAKCAPVQHVINVLSAILLGPWYALIQAFLSSLIRNVLGMGTLFAFPGSMFGALLAGLLYKYTRKNIAAYMGEIIGTSILGGITAYPVAVFILASNKTITHTSYFYPLFPFHAHDFKMIFARKKLRGKSSNRS